MSPASTRVQSVDILRGAVMILMAIDHVRVYSGMPAGGPDAGIFFTRWITHFCVPAFVFFAGTGAFFHAKKLNSTSRLARYLLTRGLLLVVLELTVIRFAWTFNLNLSEFMLAGVIWMLGWCMVLMAAFVRLSTVAIGVIGLFITFGQQLFHYLPDLFPASAQDAVAKVWNFFYPSGREGIPAISILYTIIPWIGVMMTGYAFGALLLRESAARRKICLAIGLSATALFIIIAGILVFSKEAPEDAPPALFRILSQQKYPASQLYLLMTLGPTIALLPLAERARGWLARIVNIFGRVPMFYYLLHILLIHVAALIVNYLRAGNIHQEWYVAAPYTQMPEEYRWGLPLLYLVFVIVVILLYFPCRWYAGLKARKPGSWLRYI